jgi:hypothetical protein
MPRGKTKWPVVAGVIFILGFVLAMLFTTRGNDKYRCEVCITFGGNTQCGNAAAATQTEAQRIATDQACTMLTSGMTNLEQCRNTSPRVTWK